MIVLVDKYPETYQLDRPGSNGGVFAKPNGCILRAMKNRGAKGDDATIDRLSANGEPPYYGNDVTWKSAAYINYLTLTMTNNPEIHHRVQYLRDIGSSDNGWRDKINYFCALINTLLIRCTRTFP